MSSTPPFPAPGTVLWAIDVELERDVFRSGAASKANVEYLRFQDLNLEGEGRIPQEHQDKFMVEPGKGISFFFERKLPEVLVLYDPSLMEVPKKEQKAVHWWGIDQNHPIPSGLELVYDGHPPGHCTLTVTRQMTVLSYLSLVGQISFSHRQIYIADPRSYKKG